MKETGLVRMVDDLGRVAIPKEIRRTMRIHEGDQLELFVADGDIVLKKYSKVKSISDFAQNYADSLCSVCMAPVLICDKDCVIAAAGVSKREYLERRISFELEDYTNRRRVFCRTGDEAVVPVVGKVSAANVIYPITTPLGDILGSVVILKTETNEYAPETELILAQSAAAFLGKIVEDNE